MCFNFELVSAKEERGGDGGKGEGEAATAQVPTRDLSPVFPPLHASAAPGDLCSYGGSEFAAFPLAWRPSSPQRAQRRLGGLGISGQASCDRSAETWPNLATRPHQFANDSPILSRS